MKTGPQDQDDMRTQPNRRHRHRVRHLWRLRHLRCKLHPHLHRRAERQLSVRRRQVPHKVQGYRVQGLRRLRCRGTEQWSPFNGLIFLFGNGNDSVRGEDCSSRRSQKRVVVLCKWRGSRRRAVACLVLSEHGMQGWQQRLLDTFVDSWESCCCIVPEM